MKMKGLPAKVTEVCNDCIVLPDDSAYYLFSINIMHAVHMNSLKSKKKLILVIIMKSLDKV